MGIEEMLKKGDGVRRTPGMSRKEFLRLGGAGMAGAALLGTAGCGVFESGGGGGGGGSNPKNVTFNLGDAIRDLDSATTTDSVSTDILLNVMSGLYRLDPERPSRARHGRERGHKRGPAHLHLHAAGTASSGPTATP